MEGGAGVDMGEQGGPAPSGEASRAPGRTQLHGRQGGQQRRMGSLDAGLGATSLGHPAKRASRGGLLALQMPSSECSSRRERARPAAAIRRTPSLHLQPRPPRLHGPGLHGPPQGHVSPAGRRESRPPQWDADRPSDAVSCPSDNCSELPERTRSDPLILRLSGEHKGPAGCRRRSRPSSCASPRASAGKDRTPPVPGLRTPQKRSSARRGAHAGAPHLCAHGRSGALLPGTPIAPAGTA